VIDKVDAVVQTRSEACVSRWYLEDKGIHKEMFAAMTREEIFFLPPSLYVCTYTVHHMRQGCIVPVQLLMNTARRHQGGAGAAWLATQAASILQLYQLSWPFTRRTFACLLYQDVWLADQSLCTYRLRFFFSAVAFGWHWAAAWLWCPPACALLLTGVRLRLEEVHSGRMDATGRMLFRGRF
jgi:hypothetical protein